MHSIISAMTPEERAAIRDDESSSDALWPKLVELEQLAEDHCVFKELPMALELLEGGEEEEDSDEDEGEEGDGYDEKKQYDSQESEDEDEEGDDRNVVPDDPHGDPFSGAKLVW
ncbi:hypothetical protein BJX70DRAFT_398531 [Aspergillus crustosus]